MKKNLEKILTAKAVSPTAMRLLVLDILIKQKTAISLSDLENSLKHSDRITLYRTLKTFEEKGLVHRIEDGTGAAKYALCEEDCSAEHHQDLHIHFYCTSCKETFCLPGTSIPQVSLPQNFQLMEINLTAKGICEHCAVYKNQC